MHRGAVDEGVTEARPVEPVACMHRSSAHAQHQVIAAAIDIDLCAVRCRTHDSSLQRYDSGVRGPSQLLVPTFTSGRKLGASGPGSGYC